MDFYKHPTKNSGLSVQLVQVKVYIFQESLKTDQRNDIQRFILTLKVQKIDPELYITNKPRLTCFQKIT
jgi:hypothetical protein